ncbi:MAG TPA: TetR/AcrR family transcriptional regulator [Mycobacteriales bacterium]|nr:TetR/AcrR family transcriptional regulator [Mycobacteriales bacterium]
MTGALLDRRSRREQLLDAADRIVQRDGPAASMATIAAEAGITKPVLYRHFGDKTGLYAALADRYTALLEADLRAALLAGRTREERVRLTVDAYLAGIEEQPQVYRFLLHSDEAASAQTRVRGFTRRLAALLAEGIVAESGVPDLRAQAWAHGIVGLVQAAGDWWLETSPCPRAQVVEEVTALLAGGYDLSG